MRSRSAGSFWPVSYTHLVAFELSEADIKTKVLEVVKEAKELVDLTGAEVVVSVGRGISCLLYTSRCV